MSAAAGTSLQEHQRPYPSPMALPGPLDRTRFVLEFDEDFRAPELDRTRWVPHYLPHWTTPDRSAARYDLTPTGLLLRIDADQPAWRAQDGAMRVSNLQSGSFSGPVGSAVGQHRHTDGLRVVSEQPTRRLYLPASGLVEAELRAVADPTLMLAVWLVGFEDSPERSGEICLAELFGHSVGPGGSRVNIGVKAHHDPALVDDMATVSLDIDATGWHTYAAAWDGQSVDFYVDDAHVRSVEQSPAYPLQLMVDLFEFPEGDDREPADYPKTGAVRAVRGYRWAPQAGDAG